MTPTNLITINFRIASSPGEFFKMAAVYSRDIIVLKEEVPPSKEEINRYCLALGGGPKISPYGEIRSVKYDPTITNSTAMSIKELRPHTDGTFMKSPPSRFMLSFAQSDYGGGGVSIFFPISNILAAAPGWVLEAFYHADYLFVKSSYNEAKEDSFIGPILDIDDHGYPRIRWRADEMFCPRIINHNGTRAEEAIRWMLEFLNIFEPTHYSAIAGDTLLVPNHLVLHGRTALSPNSAREVLRAWIK